MQRKHICQPGILWAVMALTFISTLWMGVQGAAAQRSDRDSAPPNADQYDLSGVPKVPTTFDDQKAAMIRGKDGTRWDLHQQLGQYYEKKGDTARADAEYAKARYWHDGPPKPQAQWPPADAKPSAWSGHYYRMPDPNHETTWDFNANGTYTWREMFRSAYVSNSTSERGTYEIKGDAIEIHVLQHNDAALISRTSSVRPEVDATAGASAGGQVHRYSFRLVGPDGRNGIVLDGVTYKPQ